MCVQTPHIGQAVTSQSLQGDSGPRAWACRPIVQQAATTAYSPPDCAAALAATAQHGVQALYRQCKRHRLTGLPGVQN